MKTFNYKKYKNCYFNVYSYMADDNAMAIVMTNGNTLNMVCTVYNKDSFYTDGVTSIKNHSKNSHLTDFLQKLGIVVEIINRVPCNNLVVGTLNSKNPQTIDDCLIDMDLLKQYCKEWDYNV